MNIGLITLRLLDTSVLEVTWKYLSFSAEECLTGVSVKTYHYQIFSLGLFRLYSCRSETIVRVTSTLQSFARETSIYKMRTVDAGEQKQKIHLNCNYHSRVLP